MPAKLRSWLLSSSLSAVLACGRVGFEPFDAAHDGGSFDAPTDDAPMAGDDVPDTSSDVTPPDVGDAGRPTGGFVLDRTFATDGRFVLDEGGIDNLSYSIEGVAVQGDGRIVLAGVAGAAANTDTLVVRLLPDGSFDPSFGAAGRVLVDVLPDESARSVTIQPDGRILVASGGEGMAGAPGGVLIRLMSDGSLDASFGTFGPGISRIDFLGDPDAPNGAYVQADGRIVFGGQSRYVATAYDFSTVRVEPDGSLDTSFGTGGFVNTDVFGADEFGSPRAVLSDGRIYLAGSTYRSVGSFDAVLVRLLSTGAPDPSFGTAGSVTVDFSALTDRATTAAIDGAGRPILVGYTNEGPNANTFAFRFQSDGTRDPGFGGGAGYFSDLGGEDVPYGVLPLPDGRIVMVGSTDRAGEEAFVVWVLLADGTPDRSVGVDGVVEIDVVPGQDDRAWGLARDGMGRILVFGATANRTQNDLALVRLVP